MFCKIAVIFSLLTLSLSSLAGEFDFEPITLEGPCEKLNSELQIKALATKKLRAYCQLQNDTLKAHGYPYCQIGECFSQINKPRKNSTPFSVSLSNAPYKPSVFISFKVVFSEQNVPASIRCHKVGLKGPFTLDQLDELSAYFQELELIERCKSKN